MIKKILFTSVSVKLCIFLIIFLAYSFLPFNYLSHYENFLYQGINHKITLQSAYETWDAQHYLFLSEKGYNKGQVSNAFAPLFPILIGIVNFFVGNSFISGMLVANIASIIGFYYFYKLTEHLYGQKIAFDSFIFLLAFPTAFYFSLIYSEGIFFALIMSSLYYLFKKNYPVASVLAFFIPWARTVGIFIIFAYIAFFIFEEKKFTWHSQVEDIVKSFYSKNFALLFSPILGLLAYFGYMFFRTGNYLEMFTAGDSFVSKPSLTYILHPAEILKILFLNLQLHGFNNSIIDRIFLLFAFIMFYYIYKKTNVTFFVYSVVMLLPFVLIGNIMSSTRHILMVFPLFIALALLFKDQKYDYIKFSLIYLMLSVQILFLVMQALNFWVA